MEVTPAPKGAHERAVPSFFRDVLGLRILEWAESRCVLEIPMHDQLLNSAGIVAGPVIGAAVDMGGVLAGCFSPDPERRINVVTVGFTVAFMSSVSSGTLRAVAVKKGGGRKIYTSTVDVFSEGGELIATGQGTFRYMD